MPGWDEAETQYRYRIEEPDGFDKFRTQAIDDGVSIIWGHVQGSEDTWKRQALRFDKDRFKTLDAAKAYLKAHPDLKKNWALDSWPLVNRLTPMGRSSACLKTDGVVPVVEDNGDHWTIINVPIASEGVYYTLDGLRAGLRSAEETAKMVPFSNSLRVLINHPESDELIDHIGGNLADDEYPTIGTTKNARLDQKNGLARVIVDIDVFKVDRRGEDQSHLITRIMSGELDNVSIGYLFNMVDDTGDFRGELYDHLETEVNPYHLAILDGHQGQCSPPVCGIGVNKKKGENNMGNNEEKPQPPEKGDTISISDMSVCSLRTKNVHVNALAEENDRLKKEAEALKKNSEALDEKVKKGDEAMKELEAIHQKERSEKVDALKEGYGDEGFAKVFPDKTIEDLTDEELDRHLAVIEMAGEEPEGSDEGDKTNAGDNKQPPKASKKLNFKAKVEDKDNKQALFHEGLTVGDLCKMPGQEKKKE